MEFFHKFIFNFKKQINLLKEKFYTNNQDYLTLVFSHFTSNWKVYLFFSCIGTIGIIDVIEYININKEIGDEKDIILKNKYIKNIKDFVINETQIKDYDWLDDRNKNTLVQESERSIITENGKFKEFENYDHGSSSEDFDLDSPEYYKKLEKKIKHQTLVDVGYLNDLVNQARSKKEILDRIIGGEEYKWYITEYDIEELNKIEKKNNEELENALKKKEEKKIIIRKWLFIVNVSSLLLLVHFS